MMVAKVKWKVVRITGYSAKSQHIVRLLPPPPFSACVLTETKRRENPFVEEDDRGAEGNPDAAESGVSTVGSFAGQRYVGLLRRPVYSPHVEHRM